MNRLFFTLTLGFVITISIFAANSARAYALDNNGCLACHGSPNLVKTGASGEKISLYVNVNDVNSGAHRYIDCTTCHTTEPHKVVTPLTKLSLAQKCGSCHQYEYQLHLSSIHGQQLVQGNPDVATCVDCHSPNSNPHSVIRVLEFNAPAYKKNISQTCAKCHNDQSLMANYGIVENVYESYMNSIHGATLQLSSNAIAQVDVATCINCHGTHDIQSVTNANSPVAGEQNLLKTCQQCHPGAGPQFIAGFLGHKAASTQNIPVAYYIRIIYNILLILIISVSSFVVLAAIIRFTMNKWKE